MNCSQANTIPIQNIVESIGCLSNGVQKGRYIWYLSPFRNEHKASFRIDLTLNRWKDFGRVGQNEGTVIDFIVQLKGCSVNDALLVISNDDAAALVKKKESISFFQEQKTSSDNSKQSKVIDKLGENKPPKNDNLEIIRIELLTNAALMDYVRERKVDVDLAQKYLKEIYLHNRSTGKTYFALAFENDSGTYDIRNKYIQGSIGKKDVTSLNLPSGAPQVLIFEGFFDFLSYVSDLRENALLGAVIVLNSVNMVNRVTERLKTGNFERIFLYLDNDVAGSTATNMFLDSFPGAAIDMRYIYEGFKDYNDFIMRKKQD